MRNEFQQDEATSLKALMVRASLAGAVVIALSVLVFRYLAN